MKPSVVRIFVILVLLIPAGLSAQTFGFMAGAGNGQGIFLFDLDKYENSKTKVSNP